MPEKCQWLYEGGYWVTGCGYEYAINDGTPSENNMNFCLYCGKRLDQKQLEEGEDGTETD